jgi:FxsC-like protein
MPLKFFFSYAREDVRNSQLRLSEFFKDLERTVKQGAPGAAGFFDTTDIQTGDDWSMAIQKALMTCQVLVCATSPTYCTHPYCGKELAVFRNREKELGASPKHRIVLPLIWLPIKPPLPSALAAYQMADDTLPDDYRIEGVEYFMRLGKKVQYEELLVRFADKIITAATENNLNDLAGLPDFSKIEDPFNLKQNIDNRGPNSGPNSVRFVYVAGSRKELENHKSYVEGYDDEGSWHWKPFYPAHADKVGLLAMEVCVQERFRYLEIDFDSDLAEQYKMAQRLNTVFIMVVDLWSMKIARYKDILNEYDNLGTSHSAVIIPANPSDPDIVNDADARNARHDLLIIALPNKRHLVSPFLQFELLDPAALRKGLQVALTGIKMKILEVGEARKRLESRAIPKPTIPVPGGLTP